MFRDGERGQAADGKAVVAGSADREENIGGLAEAVYTCDRLSLLLELFAEAVAVPAPFVAGETEHLVPPSEYRVSCCIHGD